MGQNRIHKTKGYVISQYDLNEAVLLLTYQ